jgi:hypothetical protein
MVTIKCVDEKAHEETFIVHKCFLSHHSSVFNAALNGLYIESKTQFINLFPISVESFGIFVRWLYSQRIEDDDGMMPSVKELVNLWILAVMKFVYQLQNQAIDALNEAIAKSGELPTELFGLIYENTTEKSTLRHLIVDLCVCQLGKLEFGDDVPRALLLDILKASGELKNTKASKLSKDKIKKYFVDEKGDRRGGLSEI